MTQLNAAVDAGRLRLAAVADVLPARTTTAKGAAGEEIERERLILGDLPELSVQILELCRERGRVTVAEAAKVTGANRNTIKDHLKALTKAGHIEQHGAGRGTWYGLA
jgi:predicted HTH transcriptional regulator